MTHSKKVSKRYKGTNPRKAKKEKKNMRCPVCGASIQMVPASEMNFRFELPDSANRMYWRCSNYPKCDTYIAANRDNNQIDGIMGGPSLRHKRIVIHNWEQLLTSTGRMTKQTFRAMCADRLFLAGQGIFHTRYLTEMQCDQCLDFLKQLYENNEDIHKLVDSRPNSSIWKEVRGLNTAANHGVRFNEDGTVMLEAEDGEETEQDG